VDQIIGPRADDLCSKDFSAVGIGDELAQIVMHVLGDRAAGLWKVDL
jgi:hypothetical protein